MVPAAFAEAPAERVSDRYSFIPTEPLINLMAERAWFPTDARQSGRVSDPLHTTHMITFRQPDSRVKVGDVSPQVTLFNNHAAQRRATLRAGFYRWLCANGLVVSVGMVDIRGDYIHIDGASFDFEADFNNAIGRLDDACKQIAQWTEIKLNFVQQNEFAAKGILIKNNNDPYWSKHFDANEYLTRRRDGDKSNDLWTVFNVVQENILKGGVQGAVRTTKPITQVSEIQRINESLWQLATDYGNLHGVN
jgi:hypothetical protein